MSPIESIDLWLVFWPFFGGMKNLLHGKGLNETLLGLSPCPGCNRHQQDYSIVFLGSGIVQPKPSQDATSAPGRGCPTQNITQVVVGYRVENFSANKLVIVI